MDKKYKIMNRDQIKYLAIILMTFNHIAHILLPSGTVIYEVFEDMGYFTSITMCYFMVEGYFYTHSRKDYAKRLLIFAFIAEISYGIFSIRCDVYLLPVPVYSGGTGQ